MTSYEVIVQPRAERDIKETHEFLATTAPASAERWLNRDHPLPGRHPDLLLDHTSREITMATDVDALEEERIFGAAAKLLKERNMYDLRDTCPLADFQADPHKHLDRLSQSGRPQVLTVEGGPEFVVQSAEAYRELLRRLDYAECVVGIMRGREAAARGDSLPLDEAFEEIRRDAERRTP